MKDAALAGRCRPVSEHAMRGSRSSMQRAWAAAYGPKLPPGSTAEMTAIRQVAIERPSEQRG